MLKETGTEGLIAQLFDSQPDAVVWFAPVFEDSASNDVTDFEVRYCNPAAATLLNARQEDVKGQRLRTTPLLDQTSGAFVFQQCRQVWQTNQPTTDTYYSPGFDRYFTVQRNKVDDGVLNITRDRTGEVLTKLKQREQDELYRQILDTAADGILFLKSVRNEKDEIIDFRIAHCNKKALETGRFPANAVGRTMLELLPHLHHSEQLALHKKVVETGEPLRFETTFRNEDTTEYGWFIVSLTKMGDGVISNFVDVTEKKRHEEEIESQKNLLKKILDASLDAVYTCEAVRNTQGTIEDFRFIQVNQKFRQMTGSQQQEVIGLRLLELFPATTKTVIPEKFRKVIETGAPERFEVHYQREGLEGWYDVSAARLGDNGVVVSFADVTGYKQSLLQQERYLEELKRSNESLEEFTRTASHDLKEPIRKVQFFADRLKRRLQGRMDAEEKQVLERMEAAATRMTLLVDDLLDYSHVNEQSLELEEIDLNAKLRVVLSDLDLLITEKGAIIRTGTLPAVKGIRRQLQQLLHNLLNNALKYNKPGVAPVVVLRSATVLGCESDLPVSPEDANSLFHLIEIEDNGIGFEQQYAEKIFNVFTRLHGNSEYSGTGVGLAIVQKVVKNHRGYIGAQSTPDKGSVFRLLLPV